MTRKLLLYSLLISLFTNYMFAQSSFMEVDNNTIHSNSIRHIVPKNFKSFKLNPIELSSILNQADLESETSVHQSNLVIDIPLPDGSTEQFNIVESPVMSEVLSAKYPNIKTYLGENSKKGLNIRFDYSPDYGFHAMIMGLTDVVFIDPYSFHNKDYIISYYKKDYNNSDKSNFEELEPLSSDDYVEYLEYKEENPLSLEKLSSGEELKSYRIAIACTQQYYNFHGGTTESTLAGMITTLNRVNQVYENEVAVRLLLVDNNDLLINYALDYNMSNYNTGQLINESQVVIDEFIGSENYDIGHTFSTGAGGLAQLGVPCKSATKAMGVTGTNSPIGDPYDIDYVAHEIGHQFGANHTFNGNSGSCSGNRNESTAYEPGSGSTIMAYAGICSSHNLQPNSDPYFHAASFDEINYYVNSGYGNNCAVITETGNTIPEAVITTEDYIIPYYTAFRMDGTGSDADGDTLSFCWEEMDLGPAGHPNTPTGNAPIFRSFNPTEESFRILPKMNDLLNNSQTKGELIPEYGRTLNFRLTVRDNKAGGGGVHFSETEVQVTEQAGPFEIIYPNGDEYLGINSSYNILWEVADTDESLINCQEVNIILMHKNTGVWEEITLATAVPNTGEAEITIPNLEELIGSQNRIKIVPTNNIFFDISNENFSITAMDLKEFSGGKVELYPNPNRGLFTINFKGISQKQLELNVFDLSGKLIYKEQFENNSSNYSKQVNLQEFNKGLYFLELNTPQDKTTQIISIQ